MYTSAAKRLFYTHIISADLYRHFECKFAMESYPI